MRPSFTIFAPEAQSARNERDKKTVEANAAWGNTEQKVRK